MKVVRLLVLVALIYLAWLQAPPACACSCMPIGSPEEELDRVDAVFVGTVTAVFGSARSSQIATFIGEIPTPWYNPPKSDRVSQTFGSRGRALGSHDSQSLSDEQT